MNNRQSGQVGLVVLLIAAVLLTLGIGVASQSVLETKTATQESDSSRVFNVTEKAIEEALKSLTGGSFNQEGIGVVVNVEEKADTYEVEVSEGDTAQLNLNDTAIINSIKWTDTGDCNTAAVVISLIGGPNGENVKRYAFDGQNCPVRSGNNFTPASCNGTFCSNSLPLSIVSGKLARIKVLYSDTFIQASLTGAPTQSYVVAAQGNDSGTGETRKIQATRSVPSVPSIFDYALFSGTGISK